MTGHVRPPARVVVLGLVTLGFYFWWYYFIAFRETDFHAGRRHSGFILLGLVPVLGVAYLLVYLFRELAQLSHDRLQAGLSPGLSPPRHLLLQGLFLVPAAALAAWLWPRFADQPWLVLPPLLLVLWSPVVAAGILARDVNEYWMRLARRTPGGAATAP